MGIYVHTLGCPKMYSHKQSFIFACRLSNKFNPYYIKMYGILQEDFLFSSEEQNFHISQENLFKANREG